MKTTTRLVAAAIFAIALPIAASAQTTPAPTAPAAPTAKLDTGKWTGTVVPPGSTSLDLEFHVSMAGDTVKIDLAIPQASLAFPTTQVKLEATKLSFHFAAPDESSDVACVLDKKDDGSYSGTCSDNGGEGAPMTMVPPKKGAQPTS